MRACNLELVDNSDTHTEQPGIAPVDDAVGHYVDAQSLAVRGASMDEIDAQLVEQWEQLESRAIEANAYLSPHFILPALKYLTPRAKPIFILVHRESDLGRRLVGLGVFEQVPASRYLPLPHLRTYRSPHTFCSGLLVDSGCAAAVAEAFFTFLSDRAHGWHGVEFRLRNAESTLAAQLDRSAQRFGTRWFEQWTSCRAILKPAEVTDTFAQDFLSRSRRKTLAKNRRRLQQQGELCFRVVRCGAEHQRCAETFLELEGMGWKRDEQTALLSNPSHAAFFREMIAGFARANRALFMELSLDGTVIATTSNMISGNVGFAFKVGWHSDYASASPGSLNELETVRSAPQQFADLDYLDSCSAPGSYIEKIWPWRSRFSSGVYTTSRLGSLVGSAVSGLRKLKKRLSHTRSLSKK